MADHLNLAYRYDGSFDGLLCCVFESYEKKEIPAQIIPPGVVTLYPVREVATDCHKARRVLVSIPKQMGRQALEMVQKAFLTCLEDKERYILLFLRLGYQHGRAVNSMLADEVVNTLFKAVKHLTNESNRFIEFVRFSIINGVLVAQIEPKNFVLPMIAPHFCQRLPNERFFIHDQTHGMALVYEPGQWAIIPADRVELPDFDEEELAYQRLWKLFYETIAVEGRINPRLRMTHMPKRYWRNMTEFATQATARPRLPAAVEQRQLPGEGQSGSL